MILLISGSVFLTTVYNFYVFVAFFNENHTDFGFGALSWGSTVSFVTMGALYIPAGRLADCLGRKPVFMAGIALILAGVSLEIVAPNGVVYILGRALYGAGSAAVIPVGIALLLSIVPTTRRSTALGGYYVMVGLVALLVALLRFPFDPFEWNWTLGLYLAIGVATLYSVWTKLVEIRSSDARRPLDLLGIALVTGSLASFHLAVLRSDVWGWVDSRTVALLVVAPLLALLLIYHSQHSSSAVLDHREAIDRNVLLANCAAAAFAFSLSLALFGISDLIVAIGDTSVHAEHIANLIVGAVAGVLFLPLWLGRLADRRGHRQYIVVAGFLMLVLSLWFSQVGNKVDVVWSYVDYIELNSVMWFGGVILFAVASGVGKVSLMGAVVRSFSSRTLGVGSAYHRSFIALGITFSSLVFRSLWENVDIDPLDRQTWLFGACAVGSAIVMACASGIDTRPREKDVTLGAEEVSVSES